MRPNARSVRDGWPWLGLTVLVGTLLVVLVTGSGVDWLRHTYEGDQSVGGVPGINLAEVVTDSDDMLRETVTVSGPIDEVIGPNAFILGSSGVTTFVVEGQPKLTQGRQILVTFAGSSTALLSRPEDAPLEQGTVVEVTGEVRIFEIGRFSRELNVTYEAFDRMRELEERPAILAHAIEVGPEPSGPGDKEVVPPSDGRELGYRVSEIVANPDAYQGRRVQVSGEIELILSPDVLVLSDHQLLVLAPDETFPLLEEATAYVVGEVTRLSDEHFGLEGFPDWLREREGEPILLATEIITFR